MPPLYVFTRHSLFTSDVGWSVIVETDIPIHIVMIVTSRDPIKIDRYKKIRGVSVLCGFKWHLPNTVCFDQLEPGPTKVHSFNVAIPGMLPGQHINYTFAPYCTWVDPTPAPPPLKSPPLPAPPKLVLTWPSPIEWSHFLHHHAVPYSVGQQIGDWSLNAEQPGSFKPPQSGKYRIIYTVYITAFSAWGTYLFALFSHTLNFSYAQRYAGSGPNVPVLLTLTRNFIQTWVPPPTIVPIVDGEHDPNWVHGILQGYPTSSLSLEYIP